MQFGEGDAVMARWPGSSLFFKAKINFVRDDDNEYDVEYENGTVYTIKVSIGFKGGSFDKWRKKIKLFGLYMT